MPELPEVETVVRGLQRTLPGRRVMEVRLGKTDFIDDVTALKTQLPGNRIDSVRRFGKFLVLELRGARNNGINESIDLIIHLGMTGQLTVRDQREPAPAHTHVYFELDDGRELRYTDIRRFGRMLVAPASQRNRVLGELGLDPLEISEAEFVARLGGRRARVKALLLDQRVLRGMGNIYTDESLWRARIHPARIAANLDHKALARLYCAVREILAEAISLRGSSVSDYVDSEGLPGEFQLRHRVYQREGERCFECGSAIRRIVVAGRSSYFCARCQPAPRTGKRRKRSTRR